MVKAFYPSSLEEALKIRKMERVIPYAGGTDLMVKYRTTAGAPPDFKRAVLYLGHLKELRGIYKNPSGITIGACTTLSELLDSDHLPDYFKKALEEIAGPGIRNLATLGGNICNASPAADSLPLLYASDAELEISSPDGSRKLPIEEFVLGPGKTSLGEDELLLSVNIPIDPRDKGFFRKVGTRRADALSKVSFFGLVHGKTAPPGIALGACAPTVIRSKTAETRIGELITGDSSLSRSRCRQIAEENYGDLISPIDDQRSSAEYRREIALRLLTEFLIQISNKT